MRRPRKPSGAPKSPQDELLAALQEAETQHQKRVKAGRKRPRFRWLGAVPGRLKAVVGVVVIALLALFADGLRREGGELTASLATVNGQVQLRKEGAAAGTAPTAGATLENGDVVTTGPGGGATIVFPDGSAVQLEPDTQFEVRLMDYARGGVRDRSFMVRFGAVVARVSDYFGAGSQATVSTPTAVAAARGTGFRVFYDPAQRQTYVGVVDGTVRFRTSAGEAQAQQGQMTSAGGYQVQGARGMTARQQERINAAYGQMAQYEKPPGFLQSVEYGITAFLDPFLQIIGLTPGTWSYATSYAARRSACMEALKRLNQHMASLSDDLLPEEISLVTLEELRMDPQARDQILEQLGNHMLESYQKTGTGTFLIRARARDKDRTLYQLDNAGITRVTE